MHEIGAVRGVHERALARASYQMGATRMACGAPTSPTSGRRHIHNAGPGLFEHDAVSVSPFLVIETAPDKRRSR
jgi:hypothetical protein